MESVSCDDPISKNDKVCVDCKTAKTPLWRTGPAGPKSLCNACGIRFRKNRSVIGSDKKKPPPTPTPTRKPIQSPTESSSSTNVGNRISFSNREIGGGGVKKGDLRIEVVALGKEVVLLQRRRSPVKKVKRRKIEKEYRKFGEVEEAAFVLMSLSCGLVFA